MTGPAHNPELAPLAPLEAGLGRTMARPKLIAIVCLAILTGLGWAYLGLMVAEELAHRPAGLLGPGMSVLDAVSDRAGLSPFGRMLLAAICHPTFGTAAAPGVIDIALLLLMWVAMTLAMMLPTAGPMVVTYAELADTATRKGEHAVTPMVLIFGYTGVWLGFAVIATALQIGLTRAALLDPAMASASPLFSGAVFIAAGAYQFSALKHACVTLCQRPFPFFFTNWSTEPATILRLGLRQGLYCLGCCWAMMMVMFAVGAMNVVWMAALGVIMTAEKIATTTRFSRLVGAAMLAIGVVLIANAVVAHWPTRMS